MIPTFSIVMDVCIALEDRLFCENFLVILREFHAVPLKYQLLGM